jgi:hypothetical protein
MSDEYDDYSASYDDEASLNISDITIEVTCPNCTKTYGITMKKATMKKNCRCLGGEWQIDLSMKAGKKQAKPVLRIKFVFNDGREQSVTANKITIGE